MKTTYLLLLLTLFPLGALALDSRWDPIGEYGTRYPCDEAAKAMGYTEGSKNLSITAAENGDFLVSFREAKCPTGHLCDVDGVGHKVNGVLKVSAKPKEDDYPELTCDFEIRHLKNDHLSVIETNKNMDCEKKFLCGADTSIRGEYPKLKE